MADAMADMLTMRFAAFISMSLFPAVINVDPYHIGEVGEDRVAEGSIHFL